MELTTENGEQINHPTIKEVRRCLSSLNDSDNQYLILAQDEMNYIQILGSCHSGWVVEYQEGSLESHKTSSDAQLNTATVLRILSAYLDGDSAWKTSVQWADEQKETGQPSSDTASFSNAFSLSREDRPILAFLSLFLIVGSVMVAISYHLKAETEAFISNTTAVSAEVEKLVKGGDNAVAPVYLFESPDGQRYRYQYPIYSYPPVHKQGNLATLQVDFNAPNFPDRESIRHIGTSDTISGFLQKFGVLFILMSILCWHLVSIGGVLAIENRGGLSLLFAQPETKMVARLQRWFFGAVFIGAVITGYLFIGGVLGAIMGVILSLYLFALMRILLN
ncbi:DUF3592 domain-containing protein [uncultured Neptuniibacter sp.]|uniref:DUF3592 domain-containing protein n=1 Tax=uncultured Neptuniibacter sp. TaxID=502143 RepID=UPI002611B43D|nr:DUF3592 domain-containing protein [uncultured Neptuniibacter sp.]